MAASTVDIPLPHNHTFYLSLHFAASNLPKLDKFSKSDPFIVAFQRSSAAIPWTEASRTDTVRDSHHCTFGEPIRLRLTRNIPTTIKLQALDRESPSPVLSAHTIIGSVEITARTLLAAARTQQYLSLHLERPPHAHGPAEGGWLRVAPDERPWRPSLTELRFLPCLVLMRPTPHTPLVRIEVQRERARAPGQFLSVRRSRALEAAPPPRGDTTFALRYKPVAALLDDMCNPDADGSRDHSTPIRIVLFIVEKRAAVRGGVARAVGYVDTCVRELLSADGHLRRPQSLRVGEEERVHAGALDLKEPRGPKGSRLTAADLRICFPDVVVGL